MKTRIIMLILSGLCFFTSVNAQNTTQENRIVVLGEATLEVPADQVTFRITLESIDTNSINKIYEKHKVLERKIVKLLKELKIPEKNISYTLFSIGKVRDYEAKAWYYTGRQSVIFKVDSVRLYSEIQKRLITDGFNEFESNFDIKDADKFRKKVLEKAIEAAKNKAKIMADASDRKIKRIVKIADTEDTDPVFRNFQTVMMNSRMEKSDGGSLTEFAQSVPVSTTVKVIFELE